MGFNQNLERAISAPRMYTYRRAAVNDDHAWALYRWNVELSAAVAPLVADLEVTLRNAINEQLCVRFGREDWWASKDLLHLQALGHFGLVAVAVEFEQEV